MLHSDDNNIFKPSRIKERLKMPEIQTEILTLVGEIYFILVFYFIISNWIFFL